MPLFPSRLFFVNKSVQLLVCMRTYATALILRKNILHYSVHSHYILLYNTPYKRSLFCSENHAMVGHTLLVLMKHTRTYNFVSVRHIWFIFSMLPNGLIAYDATYGPGHQPLRPPSAYDESVTPASPLHHLLHQDNTFTAVSIASLTVDLPVANSAPPKHPSR